MLSGELSIGHPHELLRVRQFLARSLDVRGELRDGCGGSVELDSRGVPVGAKVGRFRLGGAEGLLPLLELGRERLHLRAQLEHQRLGRPGLLGRPDEHLVPVGEEQAHALGRVAEQTSFELKCLHRESPPNGSGSRAAIVRPLVGEFNHPNGHRPEWGTA